MSVSMSVSVSMSASMSTGAFLQSAGIAPIITLLFSFSRTHVCLASAWTNGPDHADSLNTTYLTRVIHSSNAAFGGGTYIWTEFPSPEYAVLRCRHALGICRKGSQPTLSLQRQSLCCLSREHPRKPPTDRSMHDQFRTAWGAEFSTLGPVASIRLKEHSMVSQQGLWGAEFRSRWLPVVENS